MFLVCFVEKIQIVPANFLKIQIFCGFFDFLSKNVYFLTCIFYGEKIRSSLTLSLIYLIMMNLTKLFGSKTRADIIKYLIFRRQGVSMRTLEAEI